MGKQKRERMKPHKENPTGLPSVEDIEAEEAQNVKVENYEIVLQGVFEQIDSYSIEEKLSGLHTIESMAYNAPRAKKIAECGIAKRIGPLLVDQNVIIRACTANTLRMIAHTGMVEAQACLLEDDIMTPLCSLLKRHYMDWQPKSSQDDKSKASDEKEAFVEAVTLLWTLCEHNESAVKYSNQEDLIQILIKFFDLSIYGIDITTLVVQCLISLSEDNATAISKLISCESTLINLLSVEIKDASYSEIVCLKTAVCGLLMNLVEHTDNDSMSTVCNVVKVLSETLSTDFEEILSTLISILPDVENASSSSAKAKLRENRQIISAQQQALEILTNICSEEPEKENDDLSDSDCETDGIDDVCMDDKLYKTVSCIPVEIVEVFNSSDILKKVWNRTKAVDKRTVQILLQHANGEELLGQMHLLNYRAYLCLNNLLTSLEIDALGGIENVYRMWIEMGTTIFEETFLKDKELLESATAAMRAGIQRLWDAKANTFNQLRPVDIESLIDVQQLNIDTNVQINLIRILGTLARILVNTDAENAHRLVLRISSVLLDSCKKQDEVPIKAETLDAIMDIYTEDDTDQLAKKLNLVDRLHNLVPDFRSKMKQQRKTLGEHMAVVSTVNTNIMRFIRYKEKRLKNL